MLPNISADSSRRQGNAYLGDFSIAHLAEVSHSTTGNAGTFAIKFWMQSRSFGLLI